MREDQVTALRGERLGIDHQQLQQFTASSTWAVEPVRRKIAGLAIPLVAPEAWVLDDTGFAKESTAFTGFPPILGNPRERPATARSPCLCTRPPMRRHAR